MPITPERIQKDIEAIAACTDTPGAGATRPTFSDAWKRARDYVIGQLEEIGCKIRIDAAGNLHARPHAIAWDAPAWMSGSHIDTVPHGGDYDGVVGIVCPLECFRAATEDLKFALPLEMVIWAEEEGPTFGLGMLGSRAFIGELDATKLADLKNVSGQTYLEAGAPHGVRPADLGSAAERIQRKSFIGLIEVHIEQGVGLWNDGCPVALVTAIAGRRQYRCTLTGAANHAGSTQMNERRDALAGASDVILSLEKLARELGQRTVITVGQINAKPNALNVIAGEVVFTIDFRTAANDLLARGDQSLRQYVAQICDRRSLEASIDVTESQPAMKMDSNVCAKIERIAKAHCDGPIKQTTSGALHDAAILAPHVPTAMLFIASRDGISHNPDEFSRLADIALAAKILFNTVRDRRLE